MQSNHVNVTLKADVPKSARVLQVSGMFDLPVDERQERVWNHELPLHEKDWQVGLIVGASGAGKSVLANHLWPNKVKEAYEWDNSKSLVDNFRAELTTEEVSKALTAVGLSSIPTWVRPYSTLSNSTGYHTIGHATALAKLVEGEEVLTRPDGDFPYDTPDDYTWTGTHAQVRFKDETLSEPARDSQWRLANLPNTNGRFHV